MDIIIGKIMADAGKFPKGPCHMCPSVEGTCSKCQKSFVQNFMQTVLSRSLPDAENVLAQSETLKEDRRLELWRNQPGQVKVLAESMIETLLSSASQLPRGRCVTCPIVKGPCVDCYTTGVRQFAVTALNRSLDIDLITGRRCEAIVPWDEPEADPRRWLKPDSTTRCLPIDGSIQHED